MTITQRLKTLFSKRNYAVSDIWQIKTGQPLYSKFTISKATKEGFQKNGTVYRVVYLITKAAASVPWGVVNEEGEVQENDPLTKLFEYPNPHVTRQDLFELLVSWQELTGNAYAKKVKGGGRTTELWPISPDRIAPIPAKEVDEWIKGYTLDKSKNVAFEPDEIIHLKLFNPANPLVGISPLEAISKTVDVDNDQEDFNKAAMQNRGVIDGVLSFKREFTSQDQADAISEKLNEKYAGPKNARRMGIVGSEAKYTRTAMTPAEMDFIKSRKFNREQICIAFGMPVIYLGAMEGATFANFKESEIIFWVSTVIPLLDDMADAFNHSFIDELKPGQKIAYNISQVPAMRRALYDRANTGRVLFNMGVPFEQINRIFSFGVDEYEDWDKSHFTVSSAAGSENRDIKKNTIHLLRNEQALRNKLNAKTK